MPTFDQIYAWAERKAKLGHSKITVRQAGKHFNVSEIDIRFIVACGCHPYLRVDGDRFIFEG